LENFLNGFDFLAFISAACCLVMAATGTGWYECTGCMDWFFLGKLLTKSSSCGAMYWGTGSSLGLPGPALFIYERTMTPWHKLMGIGKPVDSTPMCIFIPIYI